MYHIRESSLIDLYRSAVAAFPRTTKRQHAVQPIIIEHLYWLPFLGLKTLFIKGEARNETRHYNPMLLIKNVNYGGDQVKITASDGREYSFDKLSLENHDVLLRCNCPDFRWRFAWYNKNDHSLYGKAPKRYESHGGPPANPTQSKGMCKHLIQLANALSDAGIFIEAESLSANSGVA